MDAGRQAAHSATAAGTLAGVPTSHAAEVVRPVRRHPSAAPLVGVALLLSGCGAGRAIPAPARGVPAGTHAQVHRRASAKSAGRTRAAALLDRLPAYPGARPLTPKPYASAAPPASSGLPASSNQHEVGPAMGIPVSPYLIDLYREWRVTASPHSVLAWVQARAAAEGLVRTGSSGGGGPGTQMEGLAFAPRGTSGQIPGVQVSVQASGQNGSLVRYDAMVIWTPPLPRAERLPAGVRSVRITAYSGSPHEQTRSVTLTHAAQVVKLADLVGSLPRDTRGAHSCPADLGRRVVLDFQGTAGRSVTEIAAQAPGFSRGVSRALASGRPISCIRHRRAV